MSGQLRSTGRRGGKFPATARLRAEILIASDIEHLVSLFANALAEHGIDGHFCLRKVDIGDVPVAGDTPDLIRRPDGVIEVNTDGRFMPAMCVLMAPPGQPLAQEAKARLRGYAELFAARALALQELADDVPTSCGLTLRERFVLGRRLAGVAPVDIATGSGLSVETVTTLIGNAARKLGCGTPAEAAAVAARRGWLAVTSLENCSSSSRNLTYKAARNG